MKFIRVFGTLAVILFAFAMIWNGQDRLFAHHTNRYFSSAAQATTLKSGKAVKPFLLGFDNFLADLFWLQAIQYVGSNVASREYPVLEGYANTITDFDPKFQYVYHFAGLLLPSIEKEGAAEYILHKGEKNLPQNWQISFDLGFVYFYYLEDYESAIAAYRRCLQKEGCLKGARTIIQSLRARIGKTEIAFSNLLEQLSAPTGEEPAMENTERLFLQRKAEEIGKLLVLQKITTLEPPKNELSELVGQPLPDDSHIRNLVAVLETLTQKKMVSPRGTLLEEILVNPFSSNPYFWNPETQAVELSLWKSQ